MHKKWYSQIPTKNLKSREIFSEGKFPLSLVLLRTSLITHSNIPYVSHLNFQQMHPAIHVSASSNSHSSAKLEWALQALS